MDYRLHCRRPHPRQKEVIDWILAPSSEVKKVHLICGRGFGKSVLAIIIAVMALSRGPGENGLLLEPDWGRIREVFLKKWVKIVPKELYTLNKTEQVITWINGARLHYRPRNVTGSVSTSDDANLGQDTTFVIDDEAALRCSKMFWINTFATIREPSPSRFYLTLTTPRLGAYNDLTLLPGHKIFRGTSFDNLYKPGYAAEIGANMSDEMYKRDVLGESVSLEGMLWPMCDLSPGKRWPHGNIDDASFQRGQPYILAGDIGGISSWYVIQYFQGRDCIVGQYHPDKGGASDDVKFIFEKYGQPSKIIIGGDAETESQVSGESAAFVIRKAISDNRFQQCNIQWPQGPYVDKQVQRDSTTCLLEKRRLTVSSSAIDIGIQRAKFLDGNRNRDFRHMIQGSEWPDPRSSSYPKNGIFKKDKRSGDGYEDACDAMLYFAVCQHPMRIGVN